MNSLKRSIDRLAIACMKNLPARFAKHFAFLLQSTPELTDRWEIHVRPIHYYEPLPDFRKIVPNALRTSSVSAAVDYRLESQAKLLSELSQYVPELNALHAESKFNFSNEYFAHFDAAAYYSLVRHLKPRSVIEIGSGFSTRIASIGLQRNEVDGYSHRLVCIEPYPQPRLLEAQVSFELVQMNVQDVPLERFEQLRSNDILFIDSSHIACAQSDVQYEIQQILPRLASGVWVHFHDIFFPHDYPSEWLIEKRIAFNEQYMLEAFLAYNSKFSVQLANYWICLEFPEASKALYSNAMARGSFHGKSSLWLRKE